MRGSFLVFGRRRVGAVENWSQPCDSTTLTINV